MEVRKKLHTPIALAPTEQPKGSVAHRMGVGAIAVEKQTLTLAEFESLFSEFADGSLITTLKLLWLHSVYFIFFIVALCQVLDQKCLTT
jgi:hypothetical protein